MSVTGSMRNISGGVGVAFFSLCEIIVVGVSLKRKPYYIKCSVGGVSIKLMLILTHINKYYSVS